MKLGIDVSGNQGCIDWKEVKATGVKYAILRSTVKSGEADNRLKDNIKGFRD